MRAKKLVATSLAVVGVLLTSSYLAIAGTTSDSSVMTLANIKPGKTYTPEELGIKIPKLPSNFNPLTATAEELSKYGFPPRPTNKEDLAQWESLMKHAQKFVFPNFEKTTLRTHPLMDSTNTKATMGTPGTSHNWSGVIDTWSKNGFDGVKGYWTLPNLVFNGEGSKVAYSSMWVGIGGSKTGSNGLFQIGTEQDMSPTGENYYPWWEVWAPHNGGTNGQIKIKKFYVYPGDQIYGYVDYHPSTGKTWFYLEDVTSNLYTHFSEAGYSADWDSSSAEWILERTEEKKNNVWYYPPLAKVDNVTFTGAEAAANGNPYFAAEDYVSHITTMYDSVGHLASPQQGLSSATSFTDNWIQFGDWDKAPS